MSTVLHNQAASRFELTTDQWLSVADYRMDGERMVITHTFVPPALRGRGIAAQLIEAALQHARVEGKKVVPQCGYVETYLRRHPADADLRA